MTKASFALLRLSYSVQEEKVPCRIPPSSSLLC
jgi:hypothetical protein